MESTSKKSMFTSLVFLCFLKFSLSFNQFSHSKQITVFQQNLEPKIEEVSAPSHDSFSHLLRKRRDVTDVESEENDSKCMEQKYQFKDLREKIKGGKRLEETSVFANETKFNLALAWAGQNDDGTLLILTSDYNPRLGRAASTLWRSTDHGRTWKDWNDHVDNKLFKQNDGLQRNPHNPKKVYLISYEHFIYVTEDGGAKWEQKNLVEDESQQKVTKVEETLEFHPEQKYEDYVMVISRDRKLYVTYDNFRSKNEDPIKSDVQVVKWGTAEQFKPKCIFVTTGKQKTLFRPTLFDLERYDSDTKEWKTILRKVANFDVQDKFMYASIYKSDNPKNAVDEKLMMISTDGGDNWSEAQLPTLTGDRFYSVLDMSEGLIFMHVDNPGDTGHGVLYTSWEDGVVYSESLRNHLFPNYNNVNDFYKVKSIRGVYLASQMKADKSIHTVITYNLGGEWQKIARPLGSKCENSDKDGCNLQIHNAYSIHRGIKARMPHSLENAVGIVLVHGNVAANLQTTPPDVYMSTDGGYNFRKVLTGPHAYEIADSGGLVVAVPLTTDFPNTIKFSTDEGHCWHTYKFTNQTIKFTGLLTEPGGKSLTVSIWGYTQDTKKWTVNVIDFGEVIPNQCSSKDYETWIPHTGVTKKSVHDGCLLGQKETFSKIKQDSWCRNGYKADMVSIKNPCVCTKEDYECEFGFYRPDNSEICVRQPEIKAEEIEICKNGHLEELVTIGYRKVPGNKCKGGSFKPKDTEVKLNTVCGVGDKSAITHDLEPEPEETGSPKGIILAILAVVLVMLLFIGAFFGYKLILLRRHKVVYRYSMLNQTDNRDDEFENALVSHDTLYNGSSDEEVEQENRSPQHQPTSLLPDVGKTQPHLKGYHDDSDDDMLN